MAKKLVDGDWEFITISNWPISAFTCGVSVAGLMHAVGYDLLGFAVFWVIMIILSAWLAYHRERRVARHYLAQGRFRGRVEEAERH